MQESASTFDELAGGTLPSLPYYLYATAHHMDTRGGRFDEGPTITNFLLGPLLHIREGTRTEIHRYLATDLGDTEENIKKARYTYQASSRLKSRGSVGFFERNGTRFTIDQSAMPALDPENVTSIVTTSARWWILHHHDEKIGSWGQGMAEFLTLSDLEEEMLTKLVRRFGERLYINASTIEEKQERRIALNSLAKNYGTNLTEK